MDKKFNPVGWFELYVNDMTRAKAFYQAVFQRELFDLPTWPGNDTQMAVFGMDMEATGAAGALVKSATTPPTPGSTTVYFSCVDCATEAARAAAAGGTVLEPKTSIGEYGFYAKVRDTEGNVIGLHSRQ